MDGEKPPLLFTLLVASGLYSGLQLDSEQYVNQLGFSGTTYLPRVFTSCLYTTCRCYRIPGSKSCNRSVLLLITAYLRATL